MGKKKLTLPKDYHFKPMSNFFRQNKTNPGNNQSMANDPLLSQDSIDSLTFSQDNSPPKPRKRLIKGAKTSQPKEIFIESDNSENSSLESTTISTSLACNNNRLMTPQKNTLKNILQQQNEMERLNEKLCDNDWLNRVLEHLRPLSLAVQAQSPAEEFKKIKKQWGFTGKYEDVDPEITDCTMCKHQHVATLFEIFNIETQEYTQTGSTCIKQFCALSEDETLLPREASLSIINEIISNAGTERATQRREMKKFFF